MPKPFNSFWILIWVLVCGIETAVILVQRVTIAGIRDAIANDQAPLRFSAATEDWLARLHESRAALAKSRQRTGPDAPAGSQPADDSRAGDGWSGSFADRVQRPEFAPLFCASLKLGLDRRYGPLLAELELPPDSEQRLIQVLAARMVGVTAADAKPSSPDRPSANSAENANDAQIRSILGPDANLRYLQFEQQRPVVDLADQVQAILAPSDISMTASQRQCFVALLANELGGAAAGGQSRAPTQAEPSLTPVPAIMITADIFEKARAILSPEQLAVFDAIRCEQDAELELARYAAGTVVK